MADLFSLNNASGNANDWRKCTGYAADEEPGLHVRHSGAVVPRQWMSRCFWLIVGVLTGLSVAAAGGVTPVRAAPTSEGEIAYSGVITPTCTRAPGQRGGDAWTPIADAAGTCHIKFPTTVTGAAVFVFGMDDAIAPQSVHVEEREISFLTINPGLGGGYSFLVVK